VHCLLQIRIVRFRNSISGVLLTHGRIGSSHILATFWITTRLLASLAPETFPNTSEGPDSWFNATSTSLRSADILWDCIRFSPTTRFLTIASTSDVKIALCLSCKCLKHAGTYRDKHIAAEKSLT
jgi:hypothetical protein